MSVQTAFPMVTRKHIPLEPSTSSIYKSFLSRPQVLFQVKYSTVPCKQQVRVQPDSQTLPESQEVDMAELLLATRAGGSAGTAFSSPKGQCTTHEKDRPKFYCLGCAAR